MTLHLVVHRPEEPPGSDAEAAVRAALRDAVWELADSHWAPNEETMLVSTDLSPDYILTHFRNFLARRGFAQPGMLLVVPIGEAAAWSGLPEDARRWMEEVL